VRENRVFASGNFQHGYDTAEAASSVSLFTHGTAALKCGESATENYEHAIDFDQAIFL
jgi:hypothetical protein